MAAVANPPAPLPRTRAGIRAFLGKGLLDEVVAACEAWRPVDPAASEWLLQADLAGGLKDRGFQVGREVRVGRGRVDLAVLCRDLMVGIELKCGRPRPATVIGQLGRYARVGCFTGLVLVCERAITVPETIAGVPVRAVGFGRAFGVAS